MHLTIRYASPAVSVLALILLSATQAHGQWSVQQSRTAVEFRGLSVADSAVVWAGGRQGTYARTADGGRTWKADTVPGASRLFFIDAHAVDRETAYLLGTDFDGGFAKIVKTVDGGATWTAQYVIHHPDVFLDGMAFWDEHHGVVFGDPIDGAFTVLTTEDGGVTWVSVPADNLPAPLDGEAAFAASGTAITVQDNRHVWFVTGGGATGRVFRSTDRGRTWQAFATPLAGGASKGLFGVAFRDTLHGVAVGGDYRQRTLSEDNLLVTDDGGETWRAIAGTALPGVQYGVAHVEGSTYVATGPPGSAYSSDDGATWTPIGHTSFNTVAFAGSLGAGWAAGVEGRIARLRGDR
jgi:photosystem II stability/assembly factor-like uncharacterized protein